MRRPAFFVVVVLGLATLGSAFSVLAQAEYRKTDAQTVNQFKNAQVAYEKALKLLDKKDVDGALDALEVSIEKMHDFPESHFLKARILYSEKEYPRALGEIELARAGFARTAELRGVMQVDRRNALAERIRRKDAAIGEQRALLAQAGPAGQQQIETVISQLQSERDVLEREVQEYAPGSTAPPARYGALHGNILLRLGRSAEALPQYEEALKIDPAYGEVANNLASIHHAAGRNEKALEIVTEAEKRGAKLHPELKKSIEAALAKRP